jgi:hypothetical protein
MTIRRAGIVVLLAGVTALLLAASASSTPSTDPALCSHSGWAHVQTDHGGVFTSERACLKYVSKGGSLYSPRLTSVLFTVNCATGVVDYGIFGSGFHSGAVVTLTLHGLVWGDTLTNVRTTVAEDETGFDGAGAFILQPTVIIPTTGTTVITLMARDAQGVNAVSSATASCPS